VFEFVVYLVVSGAVAAVLYVAARREGRQPWLVQTASTAAGIAAAVAVSRALPNLFIGDSRFFVTFLISAVFFLTALAVISAPAWSQRIQADPATRKPFLHAGGQSALRLGSAIFVAALFVMILSRTPFPKMIWGTFAYEGEVCKSCGKPASRTATYGAGHEGYYCAKCDPPQRRPVSLGVFPMALAAMSFFSVIGALLVMAIVRAHWD
jgi:hypothetical protein